MYFCNREAPSNVHIHSNTIHKTYLHITNINYFYVFTELIYTQHKLYNLNFINLKIKEKKALEITEYDTTD
jgi:hypothetical protein